MRYEDFRAAFEDALRESKLSMIGLWGDETLDLRSMARRYEVHVLPLGGRDAAPFHVAATLSFKWDALHTARTNTREEDVLAELLGTDEADDLATKPPWLLTIAAEMVTLPVSRTPRSRHRATRLAPMGQADADAVEGCMGCMGSGGHRQVGGHRAAHI